MISFIVIGRNEEKTLNLTISSIYTYLEYNNIIEYEIIYVDSKSTDQSISIVKNYPEVEIFEIIGSINAAIARNIGAQEAKGDVLIFLDSDMEIQKEFHRLIFNENKLIYPFISGQLKNIFYSKEWKVIDKNFLFSNLENDTFFPTTGGYFIVEKKLWSLVNGMKTKYKRAEDLDLGLRLANKGTLLLRKKDLFVIHHTVDYHSKERMWTMLFDGSFLYSTSLLYREHLFNKYNYKGLFRKEYTFIALLFSILLSTITPLYFLLYFFTVALRSLFQKKLKNTSGFLGRFFFLILKDVSTLIGFFTFFPQEKALNYRKVN